MLEDIFMSAIYTFKYDNAFEQTSQIRGLFPNRADI